MSNILRLFATPRALLNMSVVLLSLLFAVDVFATPAPSTYDFTTTQSALPTDLTTMISNAKTLLGLGAGAAVGLAILRGAMFFVTGLCRSIISAAS
jgi:hypothetical protein